MNDRELSPQNSLLDLESRWSSRQTYWARKLGRLRLGVEPIEEQLLRYRRVTVAITAVSGFLSTFLFCLFVAFRRADIGCVVAALLFLPIAGGACLGYERLATGARHYLAELEEYQSAKERARSAAGD
jgi:hypothetical protein